MSIKNKNIWAFLVFIALAIMTLPVIGQEETDKILSFYKRRAGEVFDGRNPLVSGVNFSFDAVTYLKVYDYDNKQLVSDSMSATYFYSFGNRDSVIVTNEPKQKIDYIDIEYPNVFIGDYVFNFFPNDTGGNDLAIGYDSKDFNPYTPVGLAIIDRDNFILKKLYMHFINEIRIDRSSKSFRFTEYQGFVFPDSIWEMKSKSGIFSTDYYRYETGITNIQIKR